jgi:hypothetical protein
MCPGTVAGEFKEEVHQFVNQQFNSIYKNLIEAVKMMRSANPTLMFLLTVSPVPLTATKTDRHVAVATMASKSILRAVADQLAANRPNVDYFPSYEIINSPVFKGVFFEPNQRSVNPHGVNFVMDNFFKCLTTKYGDDVKAHKLSRHGESETSDEFCEEELLDAFGK